MNEIIFCVDFFVEFENFIKPRAKNYNDAKDTAALKMEHVLLISYSNLTSSSSCISVLISNLFIHLLIGQCFEGRTPHFCICWVSKWLKLKCHKFYIYMYIVFNIFYLSTSFEFFLIHFQDYKVIIKFYKIQNLECAF